MTSLGLGYHALRIQGYACGAQGISANMTRDPDDCVFPNVNTEAVFGAEVKAKCFSGQM